MQSLRGMEISHWEINNNNKKKARKERDIDTDTNGDRNRETEGEPYTEIPYIRYS